MIPKLVKNADKIYFQKNYMAYCDLPEPNKNFYLGIC